MVGWAAGLKGDENHHEALFPQADSDFICAPQQAAAQSWGDQGHFIQERSRSAQKMKE